MFILKHLKTLQHVSIIIQIIFRELVCSLLKSLISKFVKNVKSQCGDVAAKHLVCVRAFCVERYAGLQSVVSVWRSMLDCSPAYLSTQNARTHTKCYAAASPHWLFTLLTNFEINDFNKEHTSSLKMIWIRSKHVGTFLSVLIWTFWTSILLYIEVH